MENAKLGLPVVRALHHAAAWCGGVCVFVRLGSHLWRGPRSELHAGLWLLFDRGRNGTAVLHRHLARFGVEARRSAARHGPAC